MKKLLVYIVTIVVVVSCFCGCQSDDSTETSENTQNETETTQPSDASTETADNTDEISVTPEETEDVEATAEPTAEEEEYVYDEGDLYKYIDVLAYDYLYCIPNEKTELNLSGDISTWNPQNDSIFTFEKSDGKIYVTAKAVGYIKLTSTTGKTAYVFSNLEVEKTEARKEVEGLPYYLYFEKGSHTLTIYTADSEGYYTVPYLTFCSASGSVPTKTPVGTHTLGNKERWHSFGQYCYAQYAINYSSGVYLHSPCYEYKRESSILTHYYNSIGENSSGGCLRMQTGCIYWIYNNCDTGTILEIVDGSPRGTSCEKPADISESACYDPTDPVLKK